MFRFYGQSKQKLWGALSYAAERLTSLRVLKPIRFPSSSYSNSLMYNLVTCAREGQWSTQKDSGVAERGFDFGLLTTSLRWPTGRSSSNGGDHSSTHQGTMNTAGLFGAPALQRTKALSVLWCYDFTFSERAFCGVGEPTFSGFRHNM